MKELAILTPAQRRLYLKLVNRHKKKPLYDIVEENW